MVEHRDRNELVMVLSDGFTSTWTYLLTTSTDGLSWSAPRRLGQPDVGGEQLYLTLSSPDRASQRVVDGDTIDLYRIRSATSGASRWDDAVLERVPLTRRG